jgi:hypothetical protein
VALVKQRVAELLAHPPACECGCCEAPGRQNYIDIRERPFNMARAAPDLLAEIDRFSFGRNCARRVT